jgi:phage gp29-like protein
MAETKTQRGDAALTTPIGSALPQFYTSHFLNEDEYNSKLKGRQGYLVYDEMSRSDATVWAALQMVKLPIKGADWFLERGSDEKVADLIQDQLFELIDFDALMDDMLTAFDYGFWAGELLWEWQQWNGQEYLLLSDIETREQTSIQSLKLENGEQGVVQWVEASPKEIPRDKLLVLTNHKRGKRLAGISLLRPAYKHWYIKDKIYKIDAIAIERQGLGMPKIKTPGAAGKKDKARIRELARNIRASEEGYIETPEGFEFEFMDMHANSTRDPEKSINHHDRQIMKAVLAQFIELGSQGSSGSYNLSIDQSRMFLASLEGAAKNIARALNRDVVDRIIDENGFSVEERPRIKFGKIGDENIEVISSAMQKLVAVNAITMDWELEEFLRKTLRLPALPERLQDDEAYEQRETTPIAVPSADGGDSATSANIGARAIAQAKEIRAGVDRELEEMFGGRTAKATA